MANLKYQKKIVSRLTKKGISRVKINPHQIKNAEESITASDIRRLITGGVITVKQKKGNSTFRSKKNKQQKKKGRRRGKGSVKSTRNTRSPKKSQWIKNARLLRKEAKKLRDGKFITTGVYRNLYGKIKGGFFRGKKHMIIYLERNELLQKPLKDLDEKKTEVKKNEK